jgi:hypothetical protein
MNEMVMNEMAMNEPGWSEEMKFNLSSAFKGELQLLIRSSIS